MLCGLCECHGLWSEWLKQKQPPEKDHNDNKVINYPQDDRFKERFIAGPRIKDFIGMFKWTARCAGSVL